MQSRYWKLRYAQNGKKYDTSGFDHTNGFKNRRRPMTILGANPEALAKPHGGEVARAPVIHLLEPQQPGRGFVCLL